MVKLIRFLFVCVIILAIAGCGFVGITMWYFGRDLPDYQQLAHYQPPIMTRVQAGDGRLLAEYSTERRLFVPIQAIPRRVVDAFLAAEDKNFYTHHGVDPLSIFRAAITDVGRLRANRRPIGASTITQQVAKNMLLTNEVSITRKVKEILLATRIDAALPKDRILELYLNEIYLGSGAYGVAAAALTYFDKPLDQLTLAEAAFLGGLPKAPNRYNPARYPEAAKARRDWVLDRMAEDGSVTREAADEAEGQPIELHRRQQAEQVKAPYFAEEVRRQLLARYGESTLYGAGLSVRTSLDPRLQAASDKALRDGLIAYDHGHGGWRGAVAHVDPKGDWAARLAAVPTPGVATDVGWRMAVVLRAPPGEAVIGFADGDTGRIPFSQMRWARPRHANGSLGPFPRGAGDVVKPGDVVMVAPAAAPTVKDDPGKEAASDPVKGAKSAADQSAGSRTDKVRLAAAHAEPGVFTLCQVPEVSGALVAMDPHTGRVLAISGGFSFAISQFDRVTQAYRQTGSAIKPFVFLTALDHGFTPSTLVSDAPISLPQGPGLPMWSPTNYEADRFRGPTPLRIGLEQSIDTLTVRLATMVGMDPIAETIKRFGILDQVPHEYAITLGAGATTPLRLTAAYAMLVNGGKKIAPTVIDRVQDRNGKTIFRADDRPCDGCADVDWNHQPVPVIPDTREQVADPDSAYQIVTMMEGVVQRGTGTEVKAVGRPIAGKTGTTNDFRDAWFEGFTPDLAAGVYIGYDDPDSLGKDETGGHVAAPIFRDFMIDALKNTPATDFRIPPGMRVYRVSAATGLPVSGSGPSIYEAYKPGTEPGKKPDHASAGALDEDGSGDVAASQTGSGDNAGEAARAMVPASAAPDGSAMLPRGAPASGTGGLY
jgi:penicillin-binding protein 1A